MKIIPHTLILCVLLGHVAYAGGPPSVVATSRPGGINFFDTSPTFIDVGQIAFIEIEHDGIAPLTINTLFNFGSDTELGFYDEEGNLLAENDDVDGKPQSEIVLPGLEAGTYYVAVGLANCEFGSTQFMASSDSLSSGFIIVNILTGAAPTTVDSFTPIGFEFLDIRRAQIDPGEVLVFGVNYDGIAPILINTFFSSSPDTEIALYDSAGTLIDENDNTTQSLQSRLVLDKLPAGRYYLAIGLFDTTFDVSLRATSKSTAQSMVDIEMKTSPESILYGDVNCDGFLNTLDIAPFVEILETGGFSFKADFNLDRNVDLLDIAPFVNALSGL